MHPNNYIVTFTGDSNINAEKTFAAAARARMAGIHIIVIPVGLDFANMVAVRTLQLLFHYVRDLHFVSSDSTPHTLQPSMYYQYSITCLLLHMLLCHFALCWTYCTFMQDLCSFSACFQFCLALGYMCNIYYISANMSIINTKRVRWVSWRHCLTGFN